ncbi:response regulator [Caldicellulosiruptor naganoensis]|uniref:Transcriptional regulatory protein n=1 Tax=Caldicellulosiruptor naganoensis TaxID=29324 RepID=A0ABY7BKV1_9FIRM|nr:response regulator [Caldicellulosiruptor naganoensis]WAM32196.1 response regulator [Caldicellulosiruptor naganoensis]
MINVLIVEDDPMVAMVNKKYVDMLEGFAVVGIARNAEEAKEYLKKRKVDLLLLDVYMPNENGIEILKQIRKDGYKLDVIMVTADNHNKDIEEALRYGVVDYLIKPFEFSRLKAALFNYLYRCEKIKSGNNLTQEELDFLLRPGNVQYNEKKGFDRRTMEKIIEVLKAYGRPVSSEEIAKNLNISRVTAKKYLDYMEEQGMVKSKMQYGGAGRPVTLYYYIF